MAFWKTFGSQNKEMFMLFANDMLELEGDRKIVDVEFLQAVKDDLEVFYNKTSVIDALCKDSRGAQCIIQMLPSERDDFVPKTFCYASKAYAKQMDKDNEEYKAISGIFFIVIANYIVFPKTDECRSNNIILDQQINYPNMKDIAFTFVELPKYKKAKEEKAVNRLEEWCRFFKHWYETTREELHNIVDPEVRPAYESINSYNWTEAESGAIKFSAVKPVCHP